MKSCCYIGKIIIIQCTKVDRHILMMDTHTPTLILCIPKKKEKKNCVCSLVTAHYNRLSKKKKSDLLLIYLLHITCRVHNSNNKHYDFDVIIIIIINKKTYQ